METMGDSPAQFWHFLNSLTILPERPNQRCAFSKCTVGCFSPTGALPLGAFCAIKYFFESELADVEMRSELASDAGLCGCASCVESDVRKRCGLWNECKSEHVSDVGDRTRPVCRLSDLPSLFSQPTKSFEWTCRVENPRTSLQVDRRFPQVPDVEDILILEARSSIRSGLRAACCVPENNMRQLLC